MFVAPFLLIYDQNRSQKKLFKIAPGTSGASLKRAIFLGHIRGFEQSAWQETREELGCCHKVCVITNVTT